MVPAVRDLDDVTLRRAQRGDGPAFRSLVEQHHGAVWQLAVRMLAGTSIAHRAEDVVQETFARVHRALPRFDPSGPARLSTWILTIASRLTLNALRTAPRAARAVSLEALAETAVERSLAGDVDAGRRALVVARAIAELPEPARAVIVLRAYHDLDYGEIADALELDVGTVKSRLSRARAQLRARLAELDPSGGFDDSTTTTAPTTLKPRTASCGRCAAGGSRRRRTISPRASSPGSRAPRCTRPAPRPSLRRARRAVAARSRSRRSPRRPPPG